jgi:pheromone shutdown protein TraB
MEEKETQKILDKKKKFSKKIVILVILLNIIFTGAVFVAAFFNATIPDSLIMAWFAFTTTELVALAGIRIRGEQ